MSTFIIKGIRSGFQVLTRMGWLQLLLPRLSLLIFGQVTLDRVSRPQILVESYRCDLSLREVAHMTQETYHWPVGIIQTPLESGSCFTHPSFRVAEVHGATLAGNGRVFDKRLRLVLDSVASHLQKAVNPGFLVRAKEPIRAGKFLSLNWWSGSGNIYHWNRDVLSRAFALTAYAGQPVILAVPKKLDPYQEHAVRQLCKLYPLVKPMGMDFGDRWKVETAIVPSQAPNTVGSGLLHPDVADFVRHINIYDVTPEGPDIPILYISRLNCSHRRLLNEPELLKRLQSNFECTVVHIEELAYKEQVRLMQRVGVLVGVYGAGLTHLYFTRRHGLIEIHNGDSKETHFMTLAASCRSPYAQIQGSLSDPRQDFSISNQQMDQVVEAVGRFLS